MKKSKFMLIALICIIACMTSGCVEKNIVISKNTMLDGKPDTQLKDDVEINWDEVREEIEEVMTSGDYPGVSYTDFAVHEDEKVIELILPLDDTVDQLTSLSYGEAYIRQFNDIVAVQDFSIATSTDDYHGGLWDKYSIDLQIYDEKEIMFPENYFVNQIIDAGKQDPVLPQIIESSTASSDGSSATDDTNAQ